MTEVLLFMYSMHIHCNTVFFFVCAGDISQLLFRSDNENSAGSRGFTAFMQCFDPLEANSESKQQKAAQLIKL